MNSKSQLVATLFYNPDREWWARVEGRMNKTGHFRHRQHGSQLTSTSSIFPPKYNACFNVHPFVSISSCVSQLIQLPSYYEGPCTDTA